MNLYKYLHQTVIVCTMDCTLWPGMLLAIQYTWFSLSSLTARINSCDVVFTKLSNISVLYVDWLVMSVDDMYHVILAGGLQYDVVQVRFICCPAITVIGVGVNVSDINGTVKFKHQTKTMVLEKIMTRQLQIRKSFKY